MAAIAKPGRALLLQHDPAAGAGLIADWLTERGVEQTVVAVPDAARLPSPSGYDLVVSLGSEHSAADDVPWVTAEAELLRAAHAAGTPVVGVCFGGQLLARALGGAVRRGSVPIVGWERVETYDRTQVDAGPWFEWHFDCLTPPPGAHLLAESATGVEAFRLGASMGLQFHPEVTEEIVADWVLAYPHELAAHDLDGAALISAAEAPAAAERRLAMLLEPVLRPSGGVR